MILTAFGFTRLALGEVNAIKLLVEQFQDDFPSWTVVISTTTQTGYNAAKKSFANSQLIYLPFDFTWAVRRSISRIKPKLVVLAELEIWPNFLAECKRNNIMTCLVNGRLSEKSYSKYQRFNWVFSNALQSIDLICVQNKEYAARFQQLGVNQKRINVSGNLKFDSLLVDRKHPKISEFRRLAGTDNSQLVFVAGSTQAPEEEFAIKSYLALKDRHADLRLLICPRHPERFDEVASLLEKYNIVFSRRSQLKLSANSAEPTAPVVLIDAMGELKYWWGVGDIAFVGGSFGNRGGQNMLEPAALGAAVCFGPNTRNFVNEVRSLRDSSAASQLSSAQELTEFVDRCCTDQTFRDSLGDHATKLISEHQSGDNNATQATLRLIGTLMSSSVANQTRRRAA